jgi:hypothetical protein
MPHRSDDRSLGPLLHWDALRSGDGAAADRRGVSRDSPCHPVGEIIVFFMKGQERHHRRHEVLSLGFFTAAGIGVLLLCEALG